MRKHRAFRKSLCARIKQITLFVKPHARARIVRTCNTIQIKSARLKTCNKYMPQIARAVYNRGKRNRLERLGVLRRAKQIEKNCRTVPAEHRKIDALRTNKRPRFKRLSR